MALLGAGAMFAGAAATASAAKSFTIRTNEDDRIVRIGDFRTQRPNRPGGLLSGAIKEFGRPSSRASRGSGNDCTVKWKRLKIKAVFVNYGVGGSACRAKFGKLQTMVVKGRRFRTTAGVRVGTASDQVPVKHPDAERRRSSWWIASVFLPFGDGSHQPTIKAVVGNGKVSALKLYIGAGGE